MIILDTNVVSALMRRDANPAVVGWLDDQPVESVWITAVTVFEVHFGLELMTNGSKRPPLQDEFARARGAQAASEEWPMQAERQ